MFTETQKQNSIAGGSGKKAATPRLPAEGNAAAADGANATGKNDWVIHSARLTGVSDGQSDTLIASQALITVWY
jgi:hypothetical protein